MKIDSSGGIRFSYATMNLVECRGRSTRKSIFLDVVELSVTASTLPPLQYCLLLALDVNRTQGSPHPRIHIKCMDKPSMFFARQPLHIVCLRGT